MKSGKRHMTDRMELPNQDKVRTLGEKETYKFLSILEADTIKQVEMKEKNKKVSQENQKTMQQKPYIRKKYLCCTPPLKIFGTTLEVDQRIS